jgi:hypothetical protein
MVQGLLGVRIDPEYLHSKLIHDEITRESVKMLSVDVKSDMA